MHILSESRSRCCITELALRVGLTYDVLFECAMHLKTQQNAVIIDLKSSFRWTRFMKNVMSTI